MQVSHHTQEKRKDLYKDYLEEAEELEAAGDMLQAARVWDDVAEVANRIASDADDDLSAQDWSDRSLKAKAHARALHGGESERNTDPVDPDAPVSSPSEETSPPSGENGAEASPSSVGRSGPVSTDCSASEGSILSAGGELPSGSFFEQPPDVGLDSVIGLYDLKSQLRETVIRPFESPHHFERLDAEPARGHLLYGPPGTGKTLTARAIGAELSFPVAVVTPKELTSEWVGKASEHISRLFEEARQCASGYGGAVVVFDEIDSVAPSRDEGQMTNSERQAISQLLTEIQSLSDDSVPCLVVGTTNLVDNVDGALLRSGRISKQIEVPAPDDETRLELLTYYLPNDQVNLEGFDLGAFVSATDKYTAADIEGVAEEAKRIAASESAADDEAYPVSAEHIKAGVERTVGTLAHWDGESSDWSAKRTQKQRHTLGGD